MRVNREAAGAAIRSLRKARDISIEQLSEMSGISTMGLSYLERGIRKPRKDTVQKLELALGLPAGTYQRLVFADDAEIELQSIVSTAQSAAAQAKAAVSQGLVVGRRTATTALLGSYAEAQIEALNAVVSRMPSETAPDFETYISFVIDRCIQTEGLTADSWRVAAAADTADADRLITHLETLESTRRNLTSRLAGRSLSAKLDTACANSPLPDSLIAQMLGTTAEDLWVWRNQGAIPSDAIALVQTFVARDQPVAETDDR
ncbi:MAG: helix-turn-helix domain-containing protein [Mycolicibacterium sp.]|uniref:helix-turn-helix domain-containing protein n=1 Tax=Mycolicibacterium sp. TaxID=2320850 RepID=UPI003D14EB03